MSNILDVIEADEKMTSMLQRLQAAGLESELNKTGPYSVFASSEIPFDKLHEGVPAEWLKPVNKIKLISLLNNHVVNGKFSFDQLISGQNLVTVNGTILDVKISSGNVTINGVILQKQDTEASKGIVHALDTVISLN